jgi:hypothetical protein
VSYHKVTEHAETLRCVECAATTTDGDAWQAYLTVGGGHPEQREGVRTGVFALPARVADLDCGQIPDSKKPVRVTGDDQYALDRDRDGLGC